MNRLVGMVLKVSSVKYVFMGRNDSLDGWVHNSATLMTTPQPEYQAGYQP